MSEKMGPIGGIKGKTFDDGADHDGVAKIYVAPGGRGIENIKFDYVKNGKIKEGSLHGVKARGFTSTIVISHPDEYLISVEGWFDSSNVIQGIQFKTNRNISDIFGYEFDGDGTQFSLQVKDKKIIGFHGLVDSHLNSLGTYFTPISSSSSSSSSSSPPLKKLEAQGGNGREKFDDGTFDHVRKVSVGQGDSGVAYIKFEYEKDGKREAHEHGKKTLLGTEEFEVDQDDYITSMKGYYEKLFGSETEIITTLIFKTFKGITSQPFGMPSGDMFLLEGGKITGFHGSSSDVLHSIGAYISHSASPKMLRGNWIQ
ncbi:hypothetical protein EUTSA_v10012063mg, partial [Eutrema salsugineum]